MLQLLKVGCERDDRRLFSGVDFVLEAGRALQIAGPNGVGKTTLLRVLATLSNHYEGQIQWRGNNIREYKANYRAEFLFFGHHTAVKPELTPIENLQWVTRLDGAHSAPDMFAALAAVGLKGYEEFPSQHLSAGQQRRVALARLVISQHALWILDEPFTALDVDGVAWLEEQIHGHLQRGGSVLFTTHQAIGIAGVEKLNLKDFRGRASGG